MSKLNSIEAGLLARACEQIAQSVLTIQARRNKSSQIRASELDQIVRQLGVATGNIHTVIENEEGTNLNG